MKPSPALFTLAIFIEICLSSCYHNNEPSGRNSKGEMHGKISISGAFALYPLAVQWGEEYKKINPHVLLDIQGGGAGKGMTDALSGTVDIGMVSRTINSEEEKKGAYAIAVAKDAVVATINENNPSFEEMMKHGMTQKQFRKIWIEGKAKTWGEVLGTNSKDKIEVYTRSDAAGAPETWAKYLDSHQEDLLGTGVFGDPGVAEVVSKTRLAIGFNNINYVYDSKTRKPFPDIQVVPIDLNENGEVDSDESFYSTIDELNKAILDGRFPSPPARELFFVTKGKPSNELVKDFLTWVLSDGQKFVSASGYVQLADSTITSEKKKLE